MKYCANCNHLTPGEPLFCDRCGRSYDVKLCPRMHRNPRSAEVCSRCGSRDLSTPQPRVPWWAPVLEVLLTVIPGGALTIFTITLGLLLLAAVLQQPQVLSALILLSIPLGVLWWMWSAIPQSIRTWIWKLLKRRRDGAEGRGRP